MLVYSYPAGKYYNYLVETGEIGFNTLKRLYSLELLKNEMSCHIDIVQPETDGHQSGRRPEKLRSIMN